MLRFTPPKTDLRTLITLLAVASIAITLANSRRVQREVLINNTLEANRVYATKLASTTELFFQLATSQLSYSASRLSNGFNDERMLQDEVDRLREQTNSFNSVAIADANGWVRAISPETLMLKGMRLNSSAAKQALAERRPLIGRPGLSTARNLLVFISWPVWSKDGSYLGYVGGSVYLKKRSILNDLLGAQFFRDGSSLYVVDSENQLLYHQNSHLLGQTVNPLITQQQREQASNGQYQVVTSEGEAMLAGYAVVPSTGWTIISIKPTAATLVPLNSLLLQVLEHSVPFALLTVLLALILARRIALPLWQLARKASRMDTQNVSKEIDGIRSWYYESSQIKRAMLAGIALLHDKIGRLRSEAQTDPMTGLLNRRGLDAVLDYFFSTKQPFAVLALDIDRFKSVNDAFGHAAGDMVIKTVAHQLELGARQADVLCRNGGEEFLMLLPGADRDRALMVAERVRKRIEQLRMEAAGNVTISIGISFWSSDSGEDMHCAFGQAVEALYRAKNAGRNCVVVAKNALQPSAVVNKSSHE
ncbi:sensor domain-containing diguanylate cyclase [Erwinia pyrifoliae]|uniref:sensor domain-containing diguanylate cyclase n=1 Tax=Erwinia pyrifoliae TaxID=79967 RepID=UPI0022026652|nr:sensor domain-containing diguanylate cyclase [Erwinia pyrifoliae]UWS28327.1 sensor domain-containing diguanylate cyclase [Erwinia pyrifoliae]